MHVIPIGDEKSLTMRAMCPWQVKADFESWLEYSARKRVFALRKKLWAQEYKESLRAVTEACGAGTFSWGGDAMNACLQQLPGICKLIVLLANDADPNQGVNESKIQGLMKDEHVAPLLLGAYREVLQSDPNFLVPPTEGG